jgi:hypothetical protein
VRLAADLARLRLEYGDQIVDRAMATARRQPSPMTAAADRRR